MTHAYLDDLDPAALRGEIVDARKKLEDLIGQQGGTLLLSRRQIRR